MPLPAPVSRGSFDFQHNARFKKLGATALAVGRFTKAEPLKPSGLWQEPNIAIAKFRRSLFKRILYTIPGPEGPVVTDLITGYRSRIPKDITSAMRDSGLAHCLAISGLHVSLVTSIVFAVVRLDLVLIPGVSLRVDCKKPADGAQSWCRARCGGERSERVIPSIKKRQLRKWGAHARGSPVDAKMDELR